MKFRRVPEKDIAAITAEWDLLAPVRFRQIETKSDLTFHNVMTPNISALIANVPKGSLLDAGCGVGIMTSSLSKQFKTTVGVDPSAISIDIAKSDKTANAIFYNSSIEKFAKSRSEKFDVIVANMVLMDVVDLNSFVCAVSRLMHGSSTFVFSITHPFFWPKYYGYEDELWFNYNEEIFIETPFRISREKSFDLISTHVHRPISSYINSFTKAGLCVNAIREPMPSKNIDRLYPGRWLYPRYLFGSCNLKDWVI